MYRGRNMQASSTKLTKMMWYKRRMSSMEKFQIVAVPVIYLAYLIVVYLRFRKLHFFESNMNATIGLLVIYFVTFFAAPQIIIAYKSIQKFDEKPFRLTWINLPMLVYVVTFLAPYSFALNYVCKQRQKDEEDFITLQAFMIVLVVSYILYPLPVRRTKSLLTAAIAINTVNALDIMDFTSNLKYVQHYELTFHVWFYVAMVTSILSLACPLGFDEEDEEDPENVRLFKAFVTLLFTDISFCTLRSVVMHNRGSYSYGFVFACKNVISGILNIYFIVTTIRCNSCKTITSQS